MCKCWPLFQVENLAMQLIPVMNINLQWCFCCWYQNNICFWGGGGRHWEFNFYHWLYRGEVVNFWIPHLGIGSTKKKRRKRKKAQSPAGENSVITLDWHGYRTFCLGKLKWPPQIFWQASLWDIYDVFEGFAGIDSSKVISSMIRNELEEMMRLFPDK